MNKYICKEQAGNSYIGGLVKAIYNHKDIKITNIFTSKEYILKFGNEYYKNITENEILTEENLLNIILKVMDMRLIYHVL